MNKEFYNKILQLQDEQRYSFGLQAANGYEIWVTKLEDNKRYTITIKKPNTNNYIKAGELTNPELFKEFFYGDN